MVGTSPTRFPRARASPRASRSSPIPVMRRILEAVLIIRIRTRSHFVAERGYCLTNVVGEVCEPLEKSRAEFVVEPEQIREDEHLPVAANARANSDRRNRQAFSDASRHPGRNKLENERERPG